MHVRENWNRLCAQMKDKNPEISQAIFRIHMSAFDDLRKNGHRITANGQPASIVAASLPPNERFTLVCDLGRQMITASTAVINGRFGEKCVIRYADHFPHCIFIGLAAILGGIGSGMPGQKLPVTCEYETEEGSGDPLGALLPTLQACFPWAEVRQCAHAVKARAQAPAPTLSPNGMEALFVVNGAQRVDVGRASFSGTVTRGCIRKSDVLHVADRSGRQIAPDGLVMAIYPKDRADGGKTRAEEADSAQAGQHVDSLLLATEMPVGSFNGILLAKETAPSPRDGKRESARGIQTEAPVPPPQLPPEKPDEPKRDGLFSQLFARK